MNVLQVKNTVGIWLSQNLAQFPGLLGAHFVGSITTMPEDAHFPAYKDVDIHLIFADGSRILENHGPFPNILETEYCGIILEGGYKPYTEYQAPDLVLSNPEIAHHLLVDSLLYDPDGWLQRLQEPVREEYARCRWVLARVDYERKGLEQWQRIRSYAQAMDSSGSQQIQLLGWHVTYLVALLCVATLQAPSSGHQRMYEILAEHNRLDLYEEAISILSLRNVPADQFDRLLQEGIEAFDLAVQVRHTPIPFQHKLNPHQRPYFVDKCRNLFETGFPELAVGWMLAFYLSSSAVILADGPEEVRPFFAARRDNLIKMLEMDTPGALDQRYARLRKLDDHFFKLAEDLIQSNPAIYD